MGLETIRKVVNMWSAAQNWRRGKWAKNKREIFIGKQYWLNGRTSPNIHGLIKYMTSPFVFCTIKPRSSCHYLSCLLLQLHQLSAFRFASHKKPFSCSFIPFLTFCFLTPFPSFPPSCLGGTVLWRNLICNFYMRNQSHTSGSIGLAIYRPGRLMQ